mmetsp:Transcript_34251/g.72969  ORF Transcript_34251/g.72969 Transcript_34251/m.72969 type:complete len:111 (-) Transcript_34251:56-388(-)
MRKEKHNIDKRLRRSAAAFSSRKNGCDDVGGVPGDLRRQESRHMRLLLGAARRRRRRRRHNKTSRASKMVEVTCATRKTNYTSMVSLPKSNCAKTQEHTNTNANTNYRSS